MSSTSPRARRRRFRSHPDLATYLITGALVGFLFGAGLAVFGAQTPMSSVLQQVVLLGVMAAALGALVAAIVYLVVDWFHDHPRLR